METREWDVVVVGGANTDYLIHGPSLPAPGRAVRGRRFLLSAGGRGANQAVAAARLQARTAFVGRIGEDDRGEAILLRFEEEGVATRHLVQDELAPTGASLIAVDDDGRQLISTAPGANFELTLEDVEAAASLIGSTSVLLTQLEVPIECVVFAVRMAREAGARVVLDPSPPAPLPDELLANVDVVHLGAADSERLTGVAVVDRDTARSAAKVLMSRGVGAVATEAGSRGNLIVWSEGEHWLPRLPVRTLDPTGAGDAFCAALAVALAEGQTLTEAAPFANAAAALATTALGAQTALPRRRELYALLAHAAEAAGSVYHAAH